MPLVKRFIGSPPGLLPDPRLGDCIFPPGHYSGGTTFWNTTVGSVTNQSAHITRASKNTATLFVEAEATAFFFAVREKQAAPDPLDLGAALKGALLSSRQAGGAGLA